ILQSHNHRNLHTFPTRRSSDLGNTRNAVGNFYARFDFSLRPLCAYQLPGGAMAIEFTGGGFDAPIPDGEGGVYLQGTFELTILEDRKSTRLNSSHDQTSYAVFC